MVRKPLFPKNFIFGPELPRGLENMPRFAGAFYVHDSQTRVQTTSAHYVFEWGNLPA
jgi:hypothetical protein